VRLRRFGSTCLCGAAQVGSPLPLEIDVSDASSSSSSSSLHGPTQLLNQSVWLLFANVHSDPSLLREYAALHAFSRAGSGLALSAPYMARVRNQHGDLLGVFTMVAKWTAAAASRQLALQSLSGHNSSSVVAKVLRSPSPSSAAREFRLAANDLVCLLNETTAYKDVEAPASSDGLARVFKVGHDGHVEQLPAADLERVPCYQQPGSLYDPRVSLSLFTVQDFMVVDGVQPCPFTQHLQALFAALHSALRTTQPAAWRRQLESVFNVDSFLLFLATNTLLGNWDSYGYVRLCVCVCVCVGVCVWGCTLVDVCVCVCVCVCV
jgi:hypothetical protein